MKLRDLDPEFLRYIGERDMHVGDPPDVGIAESDAIMFLCPTCFAKNSGRVGTHRVICNRPHVPQSEYRVGPGRWQFEGTGFDDLTLVAGSSSIALQGGCAAHFFVRAGEIVQA